MTIQTFNDATYGLSVYLNTGGIGDAIDAKVDRAYASRAVLEATVVPAAAVTVSCLTETGETLRFRSDGAGTALTTAGGRKWSPDVGPGGRVTPHHFGWNSTLSPAAQKAVIQAAVTWLGTFGPVVLNKAAVGGTLYFPQGYYQINDTIFIYGQGVVIAGEAPNTTIVRMTDQTKDVFVFGGADPFNTANTTASTLAARPENQGIRDIGIYIDGNDHTDALSSKMIVFRRSLGFIQNVKLRGYHTGIGLYGVAEGFRISDVYLASSRGPGVTVQKTDDAHIVVGLQNVNPADALAQSGGDGLSYDRSVGVFIDNVQTKDPSARYGVYDAIRIEGVDGLYVNNCHWGFGARSNFTIAPPKTIGCLNMNCNGMFMDNNSSIAGGPTKHSILITDPNATGAAIEDVVLTGLRMNVGNTAGVQLSAPGLNKFVMTGFSMNQGPATKVGSQGIRISNGINIKISDGFIGSCRGGFYVLVDNNAATKRVSITDLTCQDENAVGDATEGFRFNTNIENLIVTGNTILNCNNKPIEMIGAGGGVKSQIFKDNLTDGAKILTAAAVLSVPLWADRYWVTGATSIHSIDDATAGYSEFADRHITLIFSEPITILTTGNMGMRSTFNAVAGSALTLAFVNGDWREVSRQS
jgi:hypothetical protein